VSALPRERGGLRVTGGAGRDLLISAGRSRRAAPSGQSPRDAVIGLARPGRSGTRDARCGGAARHRCGGGRARPLSGRAAAGGLWTWSPSLLAGAVVRRTPVRSPRSRSTGRARTPEGGGNPPGGGSRQHAPVPLHDGCVGRQWLSLDAGATKGAVLPGCAAERAGRTAGAVHCCAGGADDAVVCRLQSSGAPLGVWRQL
jgi:hypothetical protein